MIAHLVSGLQAVTGRTASRAEIDMHLEGIAAIMESHFAYEERQLLPGATVNLDAKQRIRSRSGLVSLGRRHACPPPR